MVFGALGKTPDKTKQILDRFATHDVELLAREQALYHDEHQLIQSSREASEELMLILEQELGDVPPESEATMAVERPTPPL